MNNSNGVNHELRGYYDSSDNYIELNGYYDSTGEYRNSDGTYQSNGWYDQSGYYYKLNGYFDSNNNYYKSIGYYDSSGNYHNSDGTYQTDGYYDRYGFYHEPVDISRSIAPEQIIPKSIIPKLTLCQTPLFYDSIMNLNLTSPTANKLLHNLEILLYELISMNMLRALQSTTGYVLHGGKAYDLYLDYNLSSKSFDYDIVVTDTYQFDCNQVVEALNKFCSKSYKMNIYNVLRKYGYVSDSDANYYLTADKLFFLGKRNNDITSIFIELKMSNTSTHIVSNDSSDDTIIYFNFADIMQMNESFLTPDKYTSNFVDCRIRYVSMDNVIKEMTLYSQISKFKSVKILEKFKLLCDATKIHEKTITELKSIEINKSNTRLNNIYINHDMFYSKLQKCLNLKTLLLNFNMNIVAPFDTDFFSDAYLYKEKQITIINDILDTDPNGQAALQSYTGTGYTTLTTISQVKYLNDIHDNVVLFKEVQKVIPNVNMHNITECEFLENIYKLDKRTVDSQINADEFYVYSGNAPMIFSTAGMIFSDELQLIYEKNCVLYIPMFISTSYDPKVGYRFYSSNANRIIYKILLSKSDSDIWFLTDHASSVESEREILLRNNIYFLITNVTKQIARHESGTTSIVKVVECVAKKNLDDIRAYVGANAITLYNVHDVNVSSQLQHGGGTITNIPSVFYFNRPHLNETQCMDAYYNFYEIFKDRINNIINKSTSNLYEKANVVNKLIDYSLTDDDNSNKKTSDYISNYTTNSSNLLSDQFNEQQREYQYNNNPNQFHMPQELMAYGGDPFYKKYKKYKLKNLILANKLELEGLLKLQKKN